jgi:hypothetical protein
MTSGGNRSVARRGSRCPRPTPEQQVPFRDLRKASRNPPGVAHARICAAQAIRIPVRPSVVVEVPSSAAAANGLEIVVRVADFGRFPLDAEERRDAFLVNEADAAVVVWDGRDASVRRVLALVERKGIPVHVIGAPQKKPKTVRRKRDPEPPRRGLPD